MTRKRFYICRTTLGFYDKCFVHKFEIVELFKKEYNNFLKIKENFIPISFETYTEAKNFLENFISEYEKQEEKLFEKFKKEYT